MFFKFIFTLLFITSFGFSVDILTWDTFQDVSGVATSVSNPNLALDGSGNAIVTWMQTGGATGTGIYVRYSDDAGLTWKTPTSPLNGILTTTDFASKKIKLVMNDVGEAIILWETSIAPIKAKVSTTSDRGNNWSAASVISNPAINIVFPDIALNNNGKAIAVWGEGSTVEAKKFDFVSATWSASYSAPATSAFSKVTMDDNNNVILAFTDSTILKRVISSDAGGTWGGVATIPGITFSSTFGNMAIEMNNQNQAIIFAIDALTTKAMAFKSSDKGNTWTGINIYQPPITQIDNVDDSFSLSLNDFGDGAISFSGLVSVPPPIFAVAFNWSSFSSAWSFRSSTPLASISVKTVSMTVDNQKHLTAIWKGVADETESENSPDFGVTWTPLVQLSGAILTDFHVLKTNNIGNVLGIWVDKSNQKLQSIKGSWPYTPPANLQVFSFQNFIDFLLTRDLVENISWTPILNAIQYNLYKGIEGMTPKTKQEGALPILTFPQSITSYSLHGVRSGEFYYITWEDITGVESTPEVININ